ncbi:MAG: integrase [Phycisphaerae bacterium]|nr:integrase [Phycisphaerae bacterium]
MLARSGVAPRTAQELMRHSDIRLTTNIYQHLELVDTAGAVETLPDLEKCRGTVAISSRA